MAMDGKEDWLFRPVFRGLLRGESLVDGSIDLAYVALLNEALDVEQENQARADRARPKR